ncbi:ribonuclease H-like domain-containing protein [Bacteroidota bacterium]
MIRESFIFLDRISNKSEENIWSQNIKNWNEFLNAKNVFGISPARKIFYDQELRYASVALRENDSSYFKDMPESWRLYNYFGNEAVYLDIETSSMYGNITVIGLFDGYETKIMVKGFNLSKDLLKEELKKYNLIITFNGGSFDLPIIQRYFRDVLPSIPHIDLRHVCAGIGLTGGLKEIEKKLGIKRPEVIDSIYGGDAALLWKKYLATGNRRFIELLVQYNEEDIVNLRILAEHAIKKLWVKRRKRLK